MNIKTLDTPFPIKIQEHKHLPPGTIIVSSDIAEFLRERYSETSKDDEFLRRLGIARPAVHPPN